MEVEEILNNHPLTYYYAGNNKTCVTPDYLLFGKILRNLDPEISKTVTVSVDVIAQTNKLNNLICHFLNRWQKEYLTDLRESHKVKSPNQNHPTAHLDDVVLIEEEKQPRSV